MLSLHTPTCLKHTGTTSETTYQQYNTTNSLLLPNYQENFVQPGLNQPQNCIDEYPIKVEDFDAVAQDFYRQDTCFVPTSDAGCAV